MIATLRPFSRGAKRWPNRGLRCVRSKRFFGYAYWAGSSAPDVSGWRWAAARPRWPSACAGRSPPGSRTGWPSRRSTSRLSTNACIQPSRGVGWRVSARLPDWGRIREELARRDHQVTVALLWTEYKAEHPDGYQYSQFAELYRQYEKRLSVVLRQNHAPGERSFVDYCDGIAITDPVSGAKVSTELFVGELGASSYTFAMASLSQELPAWLDSHVRMYEHFGGVPALTIPDNLRSGVNRADRYEPEINPSYEELARHYGTCVMPARVRKPRDKAYASDCLLC
ncbi:MAG: DDE-type integrase/transposase/recombinase [Betaproteobacteria bacterium]|nr:DDE-type integrase/transposase/recombinase [Betaproteobacteria bacterium]